MTLKTKLKTSPPRPPGLDLRKKNLKKSLHGSATYERDEIQRGYRCHE